MKMEEWKKCKLGDICKSNINSYSEKDNWSFVNYLDTGNITENKISDIQFIDLSSESLPSRARRKVQLNDIIYSTVRPNQKHFGIIKNQPENFLVSTGFAVLHINKTIADPNFIFYNLIQNENTESLHAIAEQTTSAYPAIKPSDIENLSIKLPPLPTQQKIAAILSSLDDKIELNNKINTNLEQQAGTLFKNCFVDIYPFGGKMPARWKVGTVSEIITLHDSKRIPLSSQQREKMEKKYPYYGATSLMDYVDNYLFDGIFLLLGKDGTVVDSEGFPILQYVEGKFWVNNHAHILTGKNGFSVEMLYLLFSLTNVKDKVTGAVQPKISQGNLNSITAIIPTEEICKKFDLLIQPLFAQIRNLKQENDRLSDLRDTLLPKLINGEIEV